MNKLSKAQEREKGDHADAIRDKEEALNKAIEEYNTKLEELKGPVEKAVEEMNAAITAANEWAANIASDMETYYDERSEKWQEGDRGSAYSSWKENFGTELDEVEIEFPDALEEVSTGHPEALEELPDNPD